MKNIYLVVLVCLLNGSLQGSQSADINQALYRAFNEVIRSHMKTGNPNTGFPILSPLKMEFPVNSSIGFISLDGELKNFVIEQLDEFVVNRVYFNEKTNLFEFNFSWNNIRSTGWYDMVGNFLGVIPIFGHGNFKSNLINFRAQGTATVVFSGTKKYVSLVGLDTKMEVKRMDGDIEGILGGGDLGKLLNVAFKDLIPASLKHFERQWSTELRNVLLPFMNLYLNRVTYDDILQLSN